MKRKFWENLEEWKNNYIQTLFENNIGLFNAQTIDGFKSNIIENIKRDNNETFNSHITVKPTQLIKQLIELSVPKGKGNIVIDPFLGSGTTAVVAKNLGVDFIGIEINKEYVDIANKRIEKTNKNNQRSEV